MSHKKSKKPAGAQVPKNGRVIHLARHQSKQKLYTLPVIDKYKVVGTIRDARATYGLSDRQITILNAFVSFLPEADLAAQENLIVYASEKRLAERANGMAASTLRRQTEGLVDHGFILRRDSPNRKRYAIKGADGEILQAFGFDLSPLVKRALEFEQVAQRTREEHIALRLCRNQIGGYRRDIKASLEIAQRHQLPGDWEKLRAEFEQIPPKVKREAGLQELQGIEARLAELRADADRWLDNHFVSVNLGDCCDQNEHLLQNQRKNIICFDSGLDRKKMSEFQAEHERDAGPDDDICPLPMVLSACPAIQECTRLKIDNWHRLIRAAHEVAVMLGITEDAWWQACTVMTPVKAAISVAYILQRDTGIKSQGGYLRRLTEEAKRGNLVIRSNLLRLIAAQGKGEGAA